MKKNLKIERYGKIRIMEVVPNYYLYNRTLLIELYEGGEAYGNLTCNLHTVPGRNCAFIDVNNMGSDIVERLEQCGFGKRTGRECQSGYVYYPEFQFYEEVLRELSNANYEQYLAWQNELGADEEYISASCRNCGKIFNFIVKKSEAQKFKEYEEDGRYLIQEVFPNMSNEERGLFARGQNLCGKCFNNMFQPYQDEE